MLEFRTNGTLTGKGKNLSGYAAVFNSEANLGDFNEVIRPGAFAKSLATGSNIRALYHHDAHALLGTTQGRSLQLREDSHGLAFNLVLPNTTHGRDLEALVTRGDVQGCSFGFRVAPGGDRWETSSNGKTLRELLDVQLTEITLTADPAYLDTTIALRCLKDFRKAEYLGSPALHMLWLETC